MKSLIRVGVVLAAVAVVMLVAFHGDSFGVQRDKARSADKGERDTGARSDQLQEPDVEREALQDTAVGSGDDPMVTVMADQHVPVQGSAVLGAGLRLATCHRECARPGQNRRRKESVLNVC